MDERKIDFIVCVTESICCEECMRYISDLIIPDGYCIDVLTVFEAEGMTKGYNEATVSYTHLTLPTNREV